MNMRTKKTLWIHLLLLILTVPLSAQTVEQVFQGANEFYQAGKYQEASKEYERILKQGVMSAELYFNLGNSYYRNEQLARAILSYERAALLHPNDPDIEHNLKLAYLKTIDRIEPVLDMFLIQWMRSAGAWISAETGKLMFLFSWILLFGSLAGMFLVLRPEVVRVLRIVFFFSLVFVVFSALMMGMQSFQETAKDKAIITTQTITAKSSPDAKSVDAFVIHEGVKVKLTDAVGAWVKIILADGKVGWILSEQCERI
jgi:hypothetical protein